MIIYGGYHEVPSHLYTSQTLFHPLRGLFPPNTTFSRTWVCIGHCSIMIYSGCHKVPSHFQNNITFSLICIWNQALILPKTDYEHWKLFHADIYGGCHKLPSHFQISQTLFHPIRGQNTIFSLKL